MPTRYSWLPRILQTTVWFPVRLLLMVFAHVEVQGKEHLKGVKQAIFAINHANELDSIIITAALSPLGRFAPFFYVLAPFADFKHERFGWRRHVYNPKFFKAWGAYPVERGSRDYAHSLHDHIQLLRDGHTLCIFPEGGIARDGAHTKAHGGV